MNFLKYRCLFGAAAMALAFPALTSGAFADSQLDAVLERLDKLEKENAKLKSDIKNLETRTTKAPVQTASAPASGKNVAPAGTQGNSYVQVAIPKGAYGAVTAAENVSYTSTKDGEDDDWYFRHKPGSKLTFMTPNGEITAYGQLDVSVDGVTKGISGITCLPPACGTPNKPVGNGGWLADLSTNMAYVGIRGYQNIGDSGVKFVYQLETGIDITALAGTAESGSNESNTVRGALTTRDSYVGISTEYGSLKGGKTYAPYRQATQVMNPFSGMLGDYNVIMGNTGGDNRVEFGTRLDHAIWYESPNMNVANGIFSFAALFAPGQNRSDDSDNIAAGESDCAGGNTPTSGGFGSCSDGSFSDAYSVSATYQTTIALGSGGFKDGGSEIGVLVTGAYERHEKVNRSSDILGIYGLGSPPLGSINFPNATAQTLYNQDVADEDAAKAGVQLRFPTQTTVSGIFESLHRYVPADLEFQNERQRNGTWFALTQEITEKDNINFGWAHAFRTPGDPGQHNDPIIFTSDGLGQYANNHNAADLLTVAYKRTLYPGLMWYMDYAATVNEGSAHYDLGAGGRGVTTDCHDAFSPLGGIGSNPHCWTGSLLQGVSTGIRYNF